MAPGKITNEAFETKTAFGLNFKAAMSATITDGSYAPSLTLFEIKMSKIFSSFHFNFQYGNQNKNKAWSRSRDLRSVRLSELAPPRGLIGLWKKIWFESLLKVDKITFPFDWEFYQGIKFTCWTLLSFVVEQRLSSRVSYSVAAWMSALLRQWTFGFVKNRFFSFRVVHFCHFLKFWCQIFKILVSNCCFG